MQRLANGQNGPAFNRPKTTPAPLHSFFTDLNAQNCNVHSGQFNLNNRWNRGFEGSVKITAEQVKYDI